MISMTGVMAMINEGLAKVKDSVIAFIKKLHLNIDTNTLEKAEITPIIDWSTIQLALAPAAEFLQGTNEEVSPDTSRCYIC